jgi:integrase/recombinase XerC
VFFRWALEEGEIQGSPMERLRSPSVPEDPPAVQTEAELRALLKAGEDSDSLIGAIRRSWRVFIDTGGRLSEVANLRSKRPTATSV